jgi:hypothetical protein
MHVRGKARQSSIWVTNRLPIAVVAEPERAFICFASVVIGISIVVPYTHSGSMASLMPFWLMVEWAATLFVGGVGKFIGIQTSIHAQLREDARKIMLGRSLERWGAVLIAIGCLTYAGAVYRFVGLGGWVSIVLFAALAGANILRLLVSTAGHAKLSGERDDDGGY